MHTHTHLTAECLNYWNVGVGLFIPMLFAGLGTGVLFVGKKNGADNLLGYSKPGRKMSTLVTDNL